MGESKQKSARGTAKRQIRVADSNGNLRPQTSLSSDIGFVRTAFGVASAQLVNHPQTTYEWTGEPDLLHLHARQYPSGVDCGAMASRLD